MQRSATHFAVLHTCNWHAYCNNDSNRYRNPDACAHHLNGNAYIHTYRSCNRNPDPPCCDRYTYCHLNTHKHTNTLRIRLIKKPP